MSLQLKGEAFFEPDFPVFLNRWTETHQLFQHSHDFIEISLVTEGSGYQFINDQTIQVSKGDLFLLPLGTSHVFRPATSNKSNPLIIYNLILKTEALEGNFRIMHKESILYKLLLTPEKLEKRWYHYHDKDDQFLHLFTRSYYEYNKRLSNYRLMINSMLSQILILIHRIENDSQQLHEERPTSTKFEIAFQYINLHYSEKLTLHDLADLTYLSVSHFQNLFKKMTGQTFNKYLQNLRIQKSCELLKSTDRTIQQVANDVGYVDMNFFHLLFRRIMGLTPNHYRNNRR